MSNFAWVQRQQVTWGCNYCAMINPLCLHMFSEHSVIVSGEKAQDYLNCHCSPHLPPKPLNVLSYCGSIKGSNWAVDERLHHGLWGMVLMEGHPQ